ncbi:unnamed protein product [Ceutorhynchus assimilis]|uniref:Uncharacterized protein n=1 Tax=Ceutorhynchus assimilis TaxID=467358 RepID=A0A9N9QPJ2_9CUCU|nr:unnamed protein product [Ceutorhynchus assimilis]
MLKFVENAYLSLLEKEKEEKVELEKEKRLNEKLKAKLKALETENSDLRQSFTKNEVEILTRKNDLNTLLDTLQRERRAVLEESQRLQITKEQLDSITNLIDELKPIKERLDFKKNVTECLHNLLIKTKLRIAESEDILQELHDYLTQLEYDVEKTKDVHRHGVGHWQEEFLTARLREADVILEFDKLKREIATIKHDLEEKALIREATEMVQAKSGESSAKNNFIDKNNKLYEDILKEEEAAIANTIDFQNEIDFLKQQLKKLQDQKYDCERNIKSNEEIKMQLNEVRRSIWLREFETNQKTENLKEKYKNLAEKMFQELTRIQNNIEDKDLAIARIEEKIKELEKMNNSLEHVLKNTPLEDPACQLEEQKTDLEKEVVNFKFIAIYAIYVFYFFQIVRLKKT